jgi:hypothetical protein
LIVEALSFKLALDFLLYLKKNRINTSGIRLIFWDRVNHEFTSFEDVIAMSSYFDEQYKFIDNCILGSLCSLELFNGTSDLYDFTTEYIASDITGSYKLTTGSQYDRQRNKQRSIYTDRQISFINQAVGEYLKFYNEIRRIYVTGIYSPCYAEPGWGQNTLYLSKLKEGLLGNNTQDTFPRSIPASIAQTQLNVVNDYEVKRKKRLAILNNEILIITNRINFIEDIINNNLNINTTAINDIIIYLEQNGFDLINENYNYLLNMPIYSLNSQTLQELYQLKIDIEAEISIL